MKILGVHKLTHVLLMTHEKNCFKETWILIDLVLIPIHQRRGAKLKGSIVQMVNVSEVRIVQI